jgi:hypothetical protein
MAPCAPTGILAMSEQESKDEDNAAAPQKLSFWRMMLSVMQASFGVQNRKNKERDFTSGSIQGFVAAALMFTILFVVAVATVVNMVLN